jgi:predicted DNA-binding WGR domain protein
MDALLTLTLEAHNPARNHHRRYAVSVGRDLFGHWMVRVSYGRVGQAGQEKRYGGTDEHAMRAVVRKCLSRRRSAPAGWAAGTS